MGPPGADPVTAVPDESSAAPTKTRPDAEPAGDAAEEPQATKVNGHAEDAEMNTSVVADPVASTSQAAQAPQTNGHTSADEAGPAVDVEALAVPAIAPALAQPVYTFRFHDIGLDKMHERIYCDKYLSPDMLLADIVRITENAYYDGDPEDIAKADQMLNTAKVLVDQGFEPQFKLECDRMAKREKERAKKRSADRAKAKALQAAQDTDASTKDNVDGISTASLKRPRDSEEDESLDSSKRARTDNADVEMADANGVASAPVVHPALLAQQESRPSIASLLAQAPITNQPGLPFVNSNATSATLSLAGTAPTLSLPSPIALAPSHTNGRDAAQASPSAVAETPAKSASPSPEPLPDFILSEDDLDNLQITLVKKTPGLTVEELEQLRAACYDSIWRARKDWDKSALVSEITAMAEDFVEEVERSKRND